jgi:hypothetical protein
MGAHWRGREGEGEEERGAAVGALGGRGCYWRRAQPCTATPSLSIRVRTVQREEEERKRKEEREGEKRKGKRGKIQTWKFLERKIKDNL